MSERGSGCDKCARASTRTILKIMASTVTLKLSLIHILVSSQGWNESKAEWTSLDLPAAALMLMWRYAVITYLRGALGAGALSSEMGSVPIWKLLKAQYERWWSIDVDQFASKEHFLRYAGRYAKRPPVAQYRFFKLKKTEIGFWTRDHKLNRMVATTYTPEELVKLLADHVPCLLYTSRCV